MEVHVNHDLRRLERDSIQAESGWVSKDACALACAE